MRKSVLAVVLTMLVGPSIGLLAFPATAGAGLIASLTGEATCDSVSGNYDVVFTQTSPSDTNSASIAIDTFEVDGVAASPPVFSPNPMPPGGQATAAVTVPGDTTSILMETTVTWAGDLTAENVFELALDGDCTATTTTTSTATTSTVETTTTTRAATVVATAPTFTG